MGEIHKASLDGLKLEGAAKEHALILAILFSYHVPLVVAFQQKDEKLKSALIKVAICQWLATPFCLVGYVWAIKWTLAAKA